MGTPGRVTSEEELIQEFLAPLAAGFPGAFGLADDCAILAAPPGEELVVTTDAVAEGVHFLPDDAPEDIAWKAVAVNVSDLAGKGATPIAYVMSLAFPEAPYVSWLERFTAGLAAVQGRYGLALAGGDSDRRPGAPLSITITAFGSCPAGRMVRRGTARAGDKLFVSGTLGDGAAGLALRKEPGLARTWGLTTEERGELVGRYLRPMPRTALSRALRGCASAAMDISDGLAKDLGRLCKASGVSAIVEAGALPLSAPMRKITQAAPERLADALSGGDDYEILAAVAPGNTAAFRDAARQAGETVTEIGVVGPGTGVEIRDAAGRPVHVETPGWEHF